MFKDRIKQWLTAVDVLARRIPTFKSWNQEPSEQLVGLDISVDSIKILKINKSVTPFLVEKFAIISMPAGAIVKGEIKETVLIGNLLKDAFHLHNITTKNVALAIPRSQAIIKNIPIDSRFTASEIESRAWIEANRHFPDLVGEIYLDFTLTTPATPDATEVELILVACRKEQIKPYLEVLTAAGLTAKTIDVSCYALERAIPLSLPNLQATETIALLNLDLNVSSLIVVHNDALIHAHDQSFDGNRLMTQIKAYLKDKPEDQVTLDDAAYYNILTESLISHLRHTIHLFYSSRAHMNIDRIVLAGDCATIPELANFIKREISIETQLADPFKNMRIVRKIKEQELRALAPALMLCCGLSLSET